MPLFKQNRFDFFRDPSHDSRTVDSNNTKQEESTMAMAKQ